MCHFPWLGFCLRQVLTLQPRLILNLLYRQSWPQNARVTSVYNCAHPSFFYVVSCSKSKALYMLGKHSRTEIYPCPWMCFVNTSYNCKAWKPIFLDCKLSVYSIGVHTASRWCVMGVLWPSSHKAKIKLDLTLHVCPLETEARRLLWVQGKPRLLYKNLPQKTKAKQKEKKKRKWKSKR